VWGWGVHGRRNVDGESGIKGVCFALCPNW
jgi:hypothetical protein